MSPDFYLVKIESVVVAVEKGTAEKAERQIQSPTSDRVSPNED